MKKSNKFVDKKQNKENNADKKEKKCFIKNCANDFFSCMKKFWNFVWYDDSLLSWIVNIILAFIIIKFILYPVIGLLLGTNLPIVAVVSESMEHEVDFDTWWDSRAVCDSLICSQEDYYNKYNISKEIFLDFPLKNGFKRGDIIFLIGSKPENIDIGDVIVFNSLKANSYPIIHRVIQINNYSVYQYSNNSSNIKYSYVTKGDNNKNSIYSVGYLDENNISQEQLLGKSLFKIPYVGYVKLIFVDVINFVVNVGKGIF
jgi:signal peptidase I